MKIPWTSILSIVGVSAIITVFTIVYKTGRKDQAVEMSTEVILEAIQKNQSTLNVLGTSFIDVNSKLDSIVSQIEKEESDRVEQFKLIQKEIDILIRQDKSGETLKAINEWREWYETRYTLQQIEKKNYWINPYVLK